MSTFEENLRATTEILSKHVDLPRPIQPTDHIQNDLGLDSLGVMEVVQDIEDQFNLNIPNETLARISTVEDVARVLGELRG